MSEMNEYTPELYELVDEDGNIKQFEMIDAIELEDQQYFAMIPAFEEENSEEVLNDDGELVILKTVEENGEEILASIDDDDEYLKVLQVFMKRLEEVFEEECGCDCDCNCENDSCDCGCDCGCDCE